MEGYLGSLGKFEDDPEATEFIRELANADADRACVKAAWGLWGE